MEKNHQDLKRSSNTKYGRHSQEIIRENEIKLVMPVEENVRRLYEASETGSIENLKTLIQEDPDIVHKVIVSSHSNIIESPLHLSVSQGHLEFSQFLLDQKPELAVEVDSRQRTPLHIAAANGDVEIVQALLEKNTSSCLVRDLNGLIPLHYAVMEGQIEIIQELVIARPQSVWKKLDNGQTVLHLCIKDNHLEAAVLFAEMVIFDQEFLNATDNSGNTILDLSLMLRQFEMVRYLLSIPGIRTGTSTMNFKASDTIISIQQMDNIQRERPAKKKYPAPTPAKKKTRSLHALKKFIKYKGDWIQEVQGTMMLVATVIATVTFQGAISPPGGALQEDILFNFPNFSHSDPSQSLQKNYTLRAGTAIMSYQQHDVYWYYLLANTISFLASLSVILLIISRCPLKNRISGWVLTLSMCAAVAFLAMAYILGIRMVSHHPYSEDVYLGTGRAICIWLGIVGTVSFCFIIRFLIWVVKVTCLR